MTKNLLFSILFTGFSFACSLAQQQSLTWLNSHALPIDANDTNNGAYFSSLSNQLKETKICGLAEASHGTHEFSIEKNRIIKYLITHENYRSIGFEFGYSAMAPINNYLSTGKGDLKQLMQPLRLFNTKEIYELFQWVKTYNDSQSLKNKVTLFGFDTNYIESDIDASATYAAEYLTTHAQQYRNAQAAIPVLKKITAPDLGLFDLSEEDMAVISHLNDEIKLKGPAAVDDSGQFKKYVSLLYQGTLLSNPLARDEFMAENIANYQQESKAKTIIWGHNIHLAKDTTMAKCKGMGYHLKQKYHEQYYALGFDTFKGNVTVLDDDKFVQQSFEIQPESFSALFAKAKFPTFFIAFSNSKDDPFYNVEGNITNIYANWSKSQILPMRPGVDFDGLIFIRESTASVPLD